MAKQSGVVCSGHADLNHAGEIADALHVLCRHAFLSGFDFEPGSGVLTMTFNEGVSLETIMREREELRRRVMLEQLRGRYE